MKLVNYYRCLILLLYCKFAISQYYYYYPYNPYNSYFYNNQNNYFKYPQFYNNYNYNQYPLNYLFQNQLQYDNFVKYYQNIFYNNYNDFNNNGNNNFNDNNNNFYGNNNFNDNNNNNFEECNDKPSFVFPHQCPSSFYKRTSISYHFFPKETWSEARRNNQQMSLSSYEREKKLVDMAFQYLGKLFPWIKFYQASNLQSANIKFDINRHDDIKSVMAHAHVSYNDPESGKICLFRTLWYFRSEYYSTILHEVFHILGLSHVDSNEKSIMSNESYPTYKDIMTIAYAHFHKDYTKYLISRDEYANIIKDMKYHHQKLEADYRT